MKQIGCDAASTFSEISFSNASPVHLLITNLLHFKFLTVNLCFSITNNDTFEDAENRAKIFIERLCIVQSGLVVRPRSAESEFNGRQAGPQPSTV